MSRSFRKPYATQGYGGKRRRWAKRAANKCVRRAEDVPDGKAYRLLLDPWVICDWRFFQTGEQAKLERRK